MKKQYLYPQNMRTQTKLWLWSLKDVIVIGIALTLSVVLWAKLGFIPPAALTFVYAFLTIRMDETSILDYIKSSWRYFISTQQYFEWREK